MLPSTVERVSRNTSDEANARIRRDAERRISRYAKASRHEIDQRLHDLDYEWDIERVLEANASAAVLAGLALGSLVHRRFYLLPAAVAGFLMQHAVQGWCPPLPLLRSLGFRTASEISEERYALKALRGDFGDMSMTEWYSGQSSVKALDAVRL